MTVTNVLAVQWDREKPGHRQKVQEELLQEYLVHHLYPYSPFYRKRFDAVKLAPKNVTGMRDLAKLEPTSWAEVTAEPASFLLRPTERAIARFGERRLVMAIAKAKLRGRVPQVNRDLIDPAYKPIHWHLEGDVPIGYSHQDLERLGEAGKRMIQLAGLAREDVIATVTPMGPHLGFWQVVEGARHAGNSAIHLGDSAPLDRLETAAPTVLAGPPEALEKLLRTLGSAGRKPAGLRTLLVLGGPLTEATRDSLRALGRAVGEGDLEVVAAWAPPGVRALWAECRGGRGYHTYPDLEWLEAVDSEVAWTSLAWHGTVFLRLRLGIEAWIEDAICETCGRVGPKLLLEKPAAAPAVAPARPPVAAARPEARPAARPAVEEEAEPDEEPEPEREPVAVGDLLAGPLRIMEEHPNVAAWQAEFRRVNGQEELIVFVAPTGVDRLGPLFRELDAAVHATQFVVLRPEQVRERVAKNGVVLDLR